ncbi:MAG: 50S ribosomal protein L37ae [Nanoarchaeota archaeon]|nr:50S ribosomal protein L37ae [Nanoarchaeota archaeon]
MNSSKRFGARYGATVRKRVDKVESKQKQKHKCLFCGRFTVKRLSVGIFHCTKCKKKFTGKAYWP